MKLNYTPALRELEDLNRHARVFWNAAAVAGFFVTACAFAAMVYQVIHEPWTGLIKDASFWIKMLILAVAFFMSMISVVIEQASMLIERLYYLEKTGSG
jgi:hypothetical protein